MRGQFVDSIPDYFHLLGNPELREKGEKVRCTLMPLPHTNFIDKHRGSNEYPSSPHSWGVSGFGVDLSRGYCGPGQSHLRYNIG
jgi:hypothetical protein